MTNKLIHQHKNHHHHLLPPPPPRSTSTIQACAACRYQRRKCAPDCLLAPYFPHDRQRQFQNAHKLFGVSNITKIIRNLDRPQKDEAMRTIIYQSDVRSIDPVGGCYRIIRELQRQIEMSCAELDFVLQQLALCRTLSVQNNNNNNNSHTLNNNQFSHDLIVIDEIDYDIHLVNNPDDPQMYDDGLNNNDNNKHNHDLDLHKDNSAWDDNSNSNSNNNNNHVVLPVQENSNSSPPLIQPLHASVCDDFKSLLINDVDHEPSEKSLFDEESQKDLVKVENVCYNEEEEYEIVTDHKGIIHVEGEYGS
ncbi:putative transcription factor AS2-LOB family [Helianthus debilis subsp. tardiflorus]